MEIKYKGRRQGILTDKQDRFCQEYVLVYNATQAAINAGYSAKTAGSIGDENLKKPEIKIRVAELQQKIADSLEIRAEDIAREIRKMADSNIQDFIEENNLIRDISKIPRAKAAAIQSIKTTEYITGSGDNEQRRIVTEIKLHDKVKCNELLGRHRGMFDEPRHKKQKSIIKVTMKKEIQN